MRITVLAAALAAASLSAHATGTVHVGYDPALTPATSTFAAPTANSNTTAYDITTSQTATTFTVDVKMNGTAGTGADNFSNLYFGAYVGNTLYSLVGFEVTNGDVFSTTSGAADPRVYGVGAYSTVVQSGSVATHDAEISFTLPFSFLETDPLNAGFYKAGAGGTFYLTMSQSFGYTVQGGVANFGADALGSFTIPAAAAVPEPSMAALLGLGLAAMGVAARRRRAAKA